MRLLNGLVDLLEMARRQIGFERSKNQLHEATINALIEEKNNLQAELERTKTALDNYKSFARQQGELVNKLDADKTRILGESNKLNSQCLELAAKIVCLEADKNDKDINFKKLQKEREWLVERVQTLESQREGFITKIHSHRDARRIIANELKKLDKIDSSFGSLEE